MKIHIYMCVEHLKASDLAIRHITVSQAVVSSITAKRMLKVLPNILQSIIVGYYSGVHWVTQSSKVVGT